MTAEQGLLAMEAVMEQTLPAKDSTPASVAVMSVNWPRFISQFTNHQAPPFYSELAKPLLAGKFSPETGKNIPAAQPNLRDRLDQAPASKRTNLMLDHVRDQVIKVLDLDTSFPLNRHQPLQELGLDSLMAVELRNLLATGLRLEQPLPVTLAFDYTTSDALARVLAPESLWRRKTCCARVHIIRSRGWQAGGHF